MHRLKVMALDRHLQFHCSTYNRHVSHFLLLHRQGQRRMLFKLVVQLDQIFEMAQIFVTFQQSEIIETVEVIGVKYTT